MILDIIIIAILFLFVIIGTVKGGVKTIFSLAGLCLSVFFASLFGPSLSQWIYTVFFQKGIVNGVQSAVSGAVSGSATADIANALPDYVYSVLSTFGITKESFVQQASGIAADSQNAAVNAVEGLLKPVLCSIISFFVIIILFILFLIAMKLLTRLILRLFELPGLHLINGLFGCILGAAEGLVFVYLLVLLYKLISPFGTDVSFITPELIEQSVIFKSMFNLNIFNGITDLSGSLGAVFGNG